MSKIIKIAPPNNDAISTDDFKASVYYPFLIDKDEILSVSICPVTHSGGNYPKGGLTRYRVSIIYRNQKEVQFSYTNLKLALILVDIIHVLCNQ